MSTSTTTSTSTTCSVYTLPSIGTFTHSAKYTFLTSTLPSGLSISTYPVGNAPYTHLFSTSNIALTPPYLSLTVPGGQSAFPISSAQIATTATNILHASVRTTGILSSEPGTCQSSFFYRSDSQEIDIEFLSNRSAASNALNSLPNQGGASSWTNQQKKRLPLHYTNQAVNRSVPETTAFGPSPVGWDDEEHEYRVDWVAGAVSFWVDGVQQDEFSSNVPTEAGSWLWSNWANGDPGWTTGPPVRNSVFKIRAIEMYYNTTDSGC